MLPTLCITKVGFAAALLSLKTVSETAWTSCLGVHHEGPYGTLLFDFENSDPPVWLTIWIILA